jgi:hypothetical protein
MNKIKVLNVKTGKVSILTKFAVDQLKKGNHFKDFEILTNPTTTIPAQPKPVIADEVVEETFVDGGDESTDEPSETKRTYRKRKEQ